MGTPRDAGSDSHLVTRLLADLVGGDQAAFDRLLPIVYAELKAVAARQLNRERPDHTLDPTSLVHEVYLRLSGQREPRYHDRAHFFGVAARAMRRILVDHARARLRQKRDGGIQAELTTGVASVDPASDVLAIDDALERLALIDARQARVVELRYFAGLSLDETATALGISPATVKRDWVLARGWLKDAIGVDP
mgnify:FL=1